MEIFVNDQKHDVADNATLNDVLQYLKLENFKGVAVAIGERVIPRTKWETQQVINGDNILIIKATQGG